MSRRERGTSTFLRKTIGRCEFGVKPGYDLAVGSISSNSTYREFNSAEHGNSSHSILSEAFASLQKAVASGVDCKQ